MSDDKDAVKYFDNAYKYAFSNTGKIFDIARSTQSTEQKHALIHALVVGAFVAGAQSVERK